MNSRFSYNPANVSLEGRGGTSAFLNSKYSEYVCMRMWHCKIGVNKSRKKVTFMEVFL